MYKNLKIKVTILVFLFCFTNGIVYGQSPKIHDINSSTGQLDSVAYDHNNKTITLYRNALNKSLSQTLNYKLEPSDAKAEDLYKSGSLFDFSKATDQTIKLPIIIGKGGKKEIVEYAVKLHLGYRNLKPIMDGSNTNLHYVLTSTEKDVEFKMAMDENKVYILAVKYGGKIGSLSTYDVQNSDYDIYVYDILAKARKPIKLNTDGKKIIDIISIDNVLYGIAQVSTDATETGKNGSCVYRIYKWANVLEGSKPIEASSTIKSPSYNLLFTGRIEGDNICFYGVRGNVSTGTAQVDRYSILKNNNGNTPIQYKKASNWTPSDVSLGLYSAGYAAYADVPGVFGIVSSTAGGNALGNDFGNAGNISPKAFARVGEGGNRIPLGGGWIEELGNKYYFPVGYLLGSISASQAMYIVDFGTNPKNRIDAMSNEPQGAGNTSSPKQTFYEKNIHKEIFRVADGGLFSLGSNASNRGNIRTYKLSNGKIRIGILLAEYGFKIWEME